MYFSIYGLQEMGLDKCPKSPVLEDPLTSNIINRPKSCWNLNDSTFTIFTNFCESNSSWKSLPEWYT